MASVGKTLEKGDSRQKEVLYLENFAVRSYDSDCWAEFYAEGKWWPVDISEGDKYSNLTTYYFGHHPANRIELSRGRDLVVEPGPDSGPINFLAYPVLEISGKPATAKVEFSFKRNTNRRL